MINKWYSLFISSFDSLGIRTKNTKTKSWWFSDEPRRGRQRSRVTIVKCTLRCTTAMSSSSFFSFTTKHTAQHRDGEKNYTTLHACANFYCSTKWHSTSGWSLSIASRRSTSDTTRAIKNNLLCVRSTRQHCMCQGTQLLYYLKFFHRKSAHALSQWERLQVVAAVSEPRESVKHKFN